MIQVMALRKFLLIALPHAWLLFFFLAPFFIVAIMSLSDTAIAIPPYKPDIDWLSPRSIAAGFGVFDFENYVWVFSDDLYLKAYLSSLRIATFSTLGAVMIGLPIAYGMARAPRAWQPALVMLVILPFCTSFLIRVYAWIGILKTEGLLNLGLLTLGVIDEPLAILHTEKAILVGIIYTYLPFMILPIHASLLKVDPALFEAAADLGCRPFKTFWVITLPLCAPGILAGCFLVFIPAVGEFVIPDLMGGSNTLTIGTTLWTEFFLNRDWPVSSAVAVILLLILIVPIVVFQLIQQRQQGGPT